MSWIIDDPDLYEVVSTYSPCPCNGKCVGKCCASGGIVRRMRAPEEVARIKAEKRQRREDEILAEAEAIRSRRQAAAPAGEQDHG